MDFKTALGHTIRLKRVQRNLSVQSLYPYISQGHISAVERGAKNISSELLETVAEALGVEVYEVIRDTADLMENFEKLSPADFQKEYTDLRR